eukprot:6204917-Pleurochrysis_carterae.AAC.2
MTTARVRSRVEGQGPSQASACECACGGLTDSCVELHVGVQRVPAEDAVQSAERQRLRRCEQDTARAQEIQRVASRAAQDREAPSGRADKDSMMPKHITRQTCSKAKQKHPKSAAGDFRKLRILICLGWCSRHTGRQRWLRADTSLTALVCIHQKVCGSST